MHPIVIQMLQSPALQVSMTSIKLRSVQLLCTSQRSSKQLKRQTFMEMSFLKLRPFARNRSNKQPLNQQFYCAINIVFCRQHDITLYLYNNQQVISVILSLGRSRWRERRLEYGTAGLPSRFTLTG